MTRAADKSRLHLACLAGLAVASAAAYVAIAALSREFASDERPQDRPIPLVLALFGGAFACYLAALAIVVRARQDRAMLWTVLGAAVAFRATLLFSTPIQEIDIYRYVWDGHVTAAGVSPYRYSPSQVYWAQEPPPPKLVGWQLQFGLTLDPPPADLAYLAKLRTSSPELAFIVSRIHYQEVPTLYPPVSQAVFALSATLAPADAPVEWQLLTMKFLFVLFDLATVVVVIALLRHVGLPPGWCLAYAWCPLVLKEFANSGHLDALAVFLTTLAVYVAVRSVYPSPAGSGRPSLVGAIVAALLLALAVGAKFYPLVLAPLLVLTCVRRLGWLRSVVPAGVFLAAGLAVCWPMLPTGTAPAGSPRGVIKLTELRTPQDPSLGVRTFVREWEMNDFLFRLIMENARAPGEEPAPWFAVTPLPWRQELERVMVAVGESPADAAFVWTRLVTGILFVAAAGWLALRGSAAWGASEWLECAFLTLAWFLLLGPTLNPWYWTWVLPLIPFARGRAWLALSGLLLLYYLRFWFIHQWHAAPGPLGTALTGQQFFDNVVIWIEYGPWLLWLALAFWRRRAPLVA